jgi:Domain of unknown function (DUF5916)/Carbohydrate family 9 binding domain-like
MFAVLLIAGLAVATPHLEATPTREPPAIDGRLDDPAWRTAAPSGAFRQKFPQEGRAPVDRTEIRVLYDRESIYIGFDCPQTAPLVARLTRRDRPIESDSVTVALDSRRSGTAAFEFSVNAAGVQSDTLRFNDSESSPDWDENWEAAVARTERGWSAELRIPLRILRFDRLPTQTWGFQARRYVSARQETDEWAFIPRDAAGEVSHYGKLEGLRHLRPGSPLELRPFALGRVRRRDHVDTMLASGWDASAGAGLDAKLHVTPNLTLDATLNPDFAQVEADQVILNLTTYEVEFPEKRPFFQEGIDAFATPMPVLYTRRIGHAPPAPALRAETPFAEQLVDVPNPSTIYGAAKLSGDVGSRGTIGLLSALTASNRVQVAGDRGQYRVAEPMTLYNVARLKLKVGSNADIGAIAALTNRFETAGLYPQVPDATGAWANALCPDGSKVAWLARCFHDAYVGGPDFRWRSPSGDYVLHGQLLGSAIVGGPARQLLDGTIIGPGDLGLGGQLFFAKQGGEHWLFEAQYDGATAKLDYNDLGYMQRQAQHAFWLQVDYRTTRPFSKVLETHTRLELRDRENLSWLNVDRYVQLNHEARFANFWHYFVELHFRASDWEDREVGDGTTLQRASRYGLELGLSSDPRRRVYFEFFTQTQIIANGLWFDGEGRLTLRLLPQLDLDLAPVATYTRGEPRYAGAGAQPGEYVFGRLEAADIGVTVRATWTFTPRLTLQVYAQLFLASKHYSDFSSVVAPPGAPRPLVRLTDLPGAGAPPPVNPDLEEGVLNLNVVLRWEFLLGSTIYAVYTRSQVPNAVLGEGQSAMLDPNAVRRGPAADIFLLKLSYWWT